MHAEDLCEQTVVLLVDCLGNREVNRMPAQAVIDSDKIDNSGDQSLELRRL